MERLTDRALAALTFAQRCACHLGTVVEIVDDEPLPTNVRCASCGKAAWRVLVVRIESDGGVKSIDEEELSILYADIERPEDEL